MDETHLFGRFERLVLLLVGFVLTTVGGTLIGNYLQDRSRFRTQQESIFTEIARQMDTRMYRTRQLVLGLQGDRADMASRWRDYKATLELWNFDRTRNSALLEIYFDPRARACFQSIHADFRSLGLKIERGKPGTRTFAIATQALDRLENRLHGFDLELLRYMNARPWSRHQVRCTPAVEASK